MKNLSLLAAGAVLAGICLYSLNAQGPATSPSAETPASRSFTGKILVVSLKSDPDTTLILEQYSFRRADGREFLVGLCIDDGEPDEWRGGLPVWTAVDDISQVVEIPNREELDRRMEGSGDLSGDGRQARQVQLRLRGRA